MIACPSRLPVYKLLFGLVALALASCAPIEATNPSNTAASTAAAAVIAPNEHLRAEGIPPIPAAMVERVGRYTEFRPTAIVAWHPVKRAMLVAYRRGATTQLNLLDSAMGALTPLTDFPDPVSTASFEPKSGSYIVYARDTGGNEAAQLYRLDLATRQTTLLTDENEKHSLGAWNHAGNAILLQSTQLDRTAGDGGARRTQVTTDLYVLDPAKPEAKKKIASLPGGGWFNFRWSRDDKAQYGLEYRSAAESVIWKIDTATGKRTQLLPARGVKRQIAYANLHTTRDGRKLVYTSNEDGEFQQLTTLDFATGKRTVLSKTIPWDIDALAMHEDYVAPGTKIDARRELAAAVVNVAGRAELHVFDLVRGREIALPALPDAAKSGSVGRLRWAHSDERAGERDEIGFTVNSAQSPGDIYTLDLGANAAGKLERWSKSKVAGIDTTSFREAEIVKWKSFDGREISGLLNRPPARFTGKRPVLVNIHGGPEGQATIGFLGRNNYFINELGIAILQPNVRGSSGYGKTFLAIDNGVKREDSVKDIGALFDWIAAQPDLDATRVMVIGGSYGGYMSLAVATTYSSRIAAAIDIVGISNFVTFLERTETYRRDLRRVEYGDEREPTMRAFLEKISPLTNASNIKKPLFVIQGKNDPRVPWQEAEQIVAKARGNNIPVWYLIADNEGHGFARKPNQDFQFYAQVRFMEEFLLK